MTLLAVGGLGEDIQCTHVQYRIYAWSCLLLAVIILLPYNYSQKFWQFGGLYYNRQIKIRQNFLLAYIRMAIPYRTAKFKSANILAIAILGSTTKFNSRQYFRLYSILWV